MADSEKWGVLVYIVADEAGDDGTSLDDAAADELRRIMQSAPASDKIAVAAQIDFQHVPYVWRSTNDDPKAIPIREENASNVEVLKDFLVWGHQRCRANRYVVMLWGHGSGPAGFFSDANEDNLWQLGDPLTPLSLTQALDVLKGERGDKPLEVLLLKACFACNIEAARELSQSVNYMIASQNLIPSQSHWPYRRLFSALEHLDKSDQDAVLSLVGEVGLFYADPANRPGKAEVPYALLDLTMLRDPEKEPNAGVAAMKKLVAALDPPDMTRAIMAAASSMATPGDSALLDVVLFCEELERLSSEYKLDEIAAAAKDLREFTEEKLVLRRHPLQSAFRGVNLFFHPGYAAPSLVRRLVLFGLYRGMKFAHETGWHRMAYLNTRISGIADDQLRREQIRTRAKALAEERRRPHVYVQKRPARRQMPPAGVPTPFIFNPTLRRGTLPGRQEKRS